MGRWTGDHDGHSITVQEECAYAELYIDGELVDKQGGSFACILTGSLPDGGSVVAALTSGISKTKCEIKVNGKRINTRS